MIGRDLGFKIVRAPYPSSSKMTGEVVVKIRDDGRRGPVVGDEALLWDALQDALARLEHLQAALTEATEHCLTLEKENVEIRRQLESSRPQHRLAAGRQLGSASP